MGVAAAPCRGTAAIGRQRAGGETIIGGDDNICEIFMCLFHCFFVGVGLLLLYSAVEPIG